MAFCNETTIQVCSAEISNSGTKLINGVCISINDPNYKVQKPFVIKNPANDGLDLTVFTSINEFNLYGFSVIFTNP